MTQPLNFQSIIMTLQDFWAKHDCIIWQPYYTQVGAGTNNPATVLRVLGPEPWRVAYVEPSVRPDDGRYGENPNRLQMHYQFQVILKPDPGNPQELYLQSLEALGIDPRQHDIRFVEDNWESPALGAWGLGWEVWLDGQEITQFTYFQQAGGLTLDPVSVEITYGLERIAIALQNAGNFRNIRWGGERTYGDVNLKGEQEHSRYYFEIADVERMRQMYDLYEAEANACLAQGLVLPAHDYVLKCSHTFNVLDTRGAVGFTERQALFGRMRDLSRKVAEAYVAQRQALEFPWLDENPVDTAGAGARPQHPAQANLPNITTPQPFLLEIGTEELPAADLDAVLEQLRAKVPALLNDLRLEHGTVKVSGTPRRLVVYVENVAPNQPNLEQVVKGPPADRAFNPDGTLTKAGEGFAKSKGIDPSALEVREMDGGRYAAGVVKQTGRPALVVLGEALNGLVAGLRFDKSMRWNRSNVAFSRPVRWLLALLGEAVVPFEWGGMLSGRTTRGLRFHTPEEINVNRPQDYFDALQALGILLEVEDRRQRIQEQVQKLAAGVHGSVAPDPALLSEVGNLIEAPTAFRGSFDEAHLKLPREVLVSVMKKHQRYFPVYRQQEGEAPLLPYFIGVRNGDAHGLESVVDGNQHVIRARFADAAYFVREDVKHPLEYYVPQLATLTFQKKLGSMLDKTNRIVAIVDSLAQRLGLDEQAVQVAHRAAQLAKADLATQMVVEMTSLQGLMGAHYALSSGESQAVALAIFEHYLPRYSGDATPKSQPGLVVGLADRLDTLTGLFAAGLAPSSNKDPFAQRRAALGLVQNLIAWDLDLDLRTAIELAAQHMPVPSTAESQAAVQEFIVERLRNILLESGAKYDVVDAVLAAQGLNPARAARAVNELAEWIRRPDWAQVLPTYSRCVRITRPVNERYEIDPSAFVLAEENELWAALQSAEAAPRQPGAVNDFFQAFLPLMPAITRFFEKVMVMDEVPERRQNRLGLLQRVAALANGVADFSKLEGF